MNEEDIKKEFKKHKANYSTYTKLNPNSKSSVDEIEVLQWKKEKTFNYAVIYIRQGNTLFVKGDLGEAIYGWGQLNDLEWISNLNLSYFAGKCLASEYGRGYKTWDCIYAEETLKKYMKEYCEEDEDDYAYEEMCKKFEEAEGTSFLDYREEWSQWLYEHGYEIFGDDWWEWAPNIGMVISWQCKSHLIGLKMAMAQLKEKTIKVKR